MRYKGRNENTVCQSVTLDKQKKFYENNSHTNFCSDIDTTSTNVKKWFVQVSVLKQSLRGLVTIL